MGEFEFEIPGVVTLGWDATCDSVCVVWHGAATSAEFDSLLTAELHTIKAHHATSLLADCRRQAQLERDVQDRADGYWMPKAIAAGLKRFAVVLPENREAAVNVQDRLGVVSRETLEVGFFQGLDAARQWLRSSIIASGSS